MARPRPNLSSIQDEIFNSILMSCPSMWEAGYDIVDGKVIFSIFGIPNSVSYKRPLLATVIYDPERKGLVLSIIGINNTDKEKLLKKLSENTTYTIYT